MKVPQCMVDAIDQLWLAAAAKLDDGPLALSMPPSSEEEAQAAFDALLAECRMLEGDGETAPMLVLPMEADRG